MRSLARTALTTASLGAALALTTATPNASAKDASFHGPVSATLDAVPGEIAIDLRDDLSADDIAAFARESGIGELIANSKESEDDHIERAHVSDVRGAIERLSKDGRVEHVEPLYIYRASFVPDDPMFKEQWHMSRVGAERAWDYSCGQGVTVAVVDTGIACYDLDPYHKGTDLAGTSCAAGWNFVDDHDHAWDDQGHGTHVAGTIAQSTNNGAGVAGLAHCARLMPVKVLNENGWGTSVDVAQGIRWAARHRAQVINMSLGSPWKSSIIESAVREALSKKVIIVAAAGNSGGSVGFPAAFEGVIAVSASSPNDSLAYFSSRGPEIAIAAPGVSVTQQTICNGGHDSCELFGAFNGTSMASPHVAGAAAMLVAEGVSDPEAVRRALANTADPKDDPKKFGAGILNVGRAAARTHWVHAVMRAALGLGFFFWLSRKIRQRGKPLHAGVGTALAALFAGVGIMFFAPLFQLAPRAGALRPLVELASRPFAEWDLVASAGVHRWLPLANALPTIALAAIGFGIRSFRPWLGGFAVGTAAYLTQLALLGEVATPFPMLVTRVWLVCNAMVCVWLARISLEKDTA